MSYGYNQEKSISRLDQLLSRNEAIYQNLKFKLTQINKSSHNIHKNINYIHQYSQQPSSAKEPKPNYILPSPQECIAIPITSQNQVQGGDVPHKRSRDGEDSKVVDVSDLKEGDYCYNVENTVDFGREKEIQELFHPPAVLNNQLKDEKLHRSKAERKDSDRTAHLQIQNLNLPSSSRSPRRNSKQNSNRDLSPRTNDQHTRMSRSREAIQRIESNLTIQPGSVRSSRVNPYIPPIRFEYSNRPKENINNTISFSRNSLDEPSSSLGRAHVPSLGNFQQVNTARTPKGNSIYLSQIPKTELQANQQLEEMPTFRQLFQKELRKLEDSETEKLLKINTTQNMNQNTTVASQAHQSEKENVKISQQYLHELSNNQNSRVYQQKRQRESQRSSKVELRSSRNILPKAQQLNESSELDFLAKSTPQTKLCKQLQITLEQKARGLEHHCESFLFAPFNKVYRSPILQIKSATKILLQRKSKTSLRNKNGRISDPIKYKFKHVITDEQLMLRWLLGGGPELDLNYVESSKVVIAGGKDTLKKKLHLGLLAFLMQIAANQIRTIRRPFFIHLEHKQSGKDTMVEAHIEVKLSSEKIALLELQRAGEDVSNSVIGGSKNERVLRVTKISVGREEGWSFSVISSNRVDCEFVRCLGASRVCWAINPLIKNYDDVYNTLESMQRFTKISDR